RRISELDEAAGSAPGPHAPGDRQGPTVGADRRGMEPARRLVLGPIVSARGRLDARAAGQVPRSRSFAGEDEESPTAVLEGQRLDREVDAEGRAEGLLTGHLPEADGAVLSPDRHDLPARVEREGGDRSGEFAGLPDLPEQGRVPQADDPA